MDCNYGTCHKPFDDQFTCDNCYIPKYCSEQCKKSDIDDHSKWCSPRTFILKDFVPAKTSRKILYVGTYGEVQLMQNMSNNRYYAMKVIKKSLANEVIPLKVLFREIMIHKKLVHPNIVRLVEHFEDTIRIYIILEYVEKGSLFDLIRKNIKLSEKEACSVLVDTCAGLNYLHENEIIHRDLKPENLLISKQDSIKICDFGWSASGPGQKLTFCGTLDYMSPEMINSEPHTSKIDIWAVGILLYEMIHGSPPFRGKNPKDQYRLISSNSYSIGSHVSRPAADLIRSILQVRPESRPSIQQILSSQFVRNYSESKLKQGWKIENPSAGEGLITSIQGKVVNLSFSGQDTCLIEEEVFRKYSIYDKKGQVVSRPPQEESLKPKADPADQNLVVQVLFKNLGIDSGRATPISGRATPTSPAYHSRNNSRKGTFSGQPAHNSRSSHGERITGETSPTPVYERPQKPRMVEEVKRSHPILPRGKDFREIHLSPDVGSPRELNKPKSSFLSRFRANS